MRKIKHLFIIGLLIHSFQVFSQNTGLFGKKNIVDINFVPYVHVFTNFLGINSDIGYYRKSGTGLKSANDRLDYGFSASYIRSLSRTANVGFEFGYQKLDTKTPHELFVSDTYYYYEGRIETFRFNHFSFIPKIEFSKENSIFGIGLHNQLGFGFSQSKIDNREYVFEMYKNNFYEPTALTETEKVEFRTNMYDRNSPATTNLIFLYSLNFRKNLTKNILLNYGFRYTLNFLFRSHDTNDSTYLISNSQLSEMVKRDKRFNFVQFKIGASYVF